MVRNLAGLKSRLFWNGLRSDRQRQIGLPLIAALVIWMGWRLSGAHHATLGYISPEAVPDYLGWAALVLFVAWVILPVVIFPIDENLDPQQLATLPASRPQLVAGLTAAAFISVPVIALLAVVGTTLAQRPAALWLTLPAGTIFLVMLMVGSQGFTTLMSAVFHTRRGRDLAVFLIMGIGLASFAGYQAIRGAIDAAGLEAAATGHSLDAWWWALAPAAPARAISAAWQGEWPLAIAALLVAVGWTGLLVLGWERILRWMLVTPRQESAPSSERRKSGLASGRWEVPFVIARKELRFYLRDPRQRLVWTGTVIFVGLAVAALVVGSAGFAQFRTKEWLPMLAPVLVLMVGLPIALNQFGWERNAASYLFALPAKPRALIIGKNMAAMTGLIAETLFLSILLAWFSSSWRWVGLVVPLALGAILCLLAVGNIVSVLSPLRLPREGTDMFAQATEQGFLALISQVVSFFTIGLLLVLPASITVLTVDFGEVIAPWFTTVFTIGWGVFWYAISLGISGWLLRRRIPEVVGWVQVY
jgi:ABC-2 type transport system permease protein